MYQIEMIDIPTIVFGAVPKYKQIKHQIRLSIIHYQFGSYNFVHGQISIRATSANRKLVKKLGTLFDTRDRICQAIIERLPQYKLYTSEVEYLFDQDPCKHGFHFYYGRKCKDLTPYVRKYLSRVK